MLDGQSVLKPEFKFKKDCPDGNKFYAIKLVEIAKYFGFDGYLINVECEIKNTEILRNWL